MAKKKFLKGSEEWVLFMDYWALCQELWIPEDTDLYWNDVIKKSENFYKKHPTKFALELATTLQLELERKMYKCR